MERILLVGAAMLGVGVALAVFWLLITSSGGTTFEMIEDHISDWLGEALKKLSTR